METEDRPRPWRDYPCFYHVEKLIAGLNDRPIIRKTPEGWITGDTLKRYAEWRKDNGEKNFAPITAFRAHVPLMRNYAAGEARRARRSRYAAVVHELLCNFTMMEHLISLTPGARKALFKMALQGSTVRHQIAVANLYHLATRHLKDPRCEGEDE